METTLPLAIGVEKFKKMIDRPYYYIDKTPMIKELIDKRGEVNLFTRPRRFRKTLTLSMIQTFFERELDADGQVIDNSHYFTGMKIMESGAAYTSQMGKYPVISLSLKSAGQPDFDMAYNSLLDEIIKEFKRHRYVLQGTALLDSDKKRYTEILNRQAQPVAYAKALDFLSACLKDYHNQNVVILLDEYDVPLENARFRGFYQQMTDFIRSLFESALKTNDNLEFAVITGCLRITKESIFTGLNNLDVISILNVDYDEYFGFTEPEVQRVLQDYDLETKLEEIQQWYDGYVFGKTNVYNPWSVLKYVKSALSNYNAPPKAYWSNTSGNNIVQELIEKADVGTKEEIEILITGGTIEKPVHEEITYGDIYNSQDNLWNFLFFTGYLKKDRQRFEDDIFYVSLSIPNKEVRTIYRRTIREWFSEKIKITDLKPLYEAILNEDCETFETLLKNQLRDSISSWDSLESFYHGFMLGLISPIKGYGYHVKSNFEGGEGRSDLLLSTNDEHRPAVIMEFKRCKTFSEMDRLCDEALKQIEVKNYAAELQDGGYENILKYGICFCKKRCKIKLG